MDMIKGALLKRMEQAEGHGAAPPSKAWKQEEAAEGHTGTPFGKKWTAEEKAEHARKLAEKLRSR